MRGDVDLLDDAEVDQGAAEFEVLGVRRGLGPQDVHRVVEQQRIAQGRQIGQPLGVRDGHAVEPVLQLRGEHRVEAGVHQVGCEGPAVGDVLQQAGGVGHHGLVHEDRT